MTVTEALEVITQVDPVTISLVSVIGGLCFTSTIIFKTLVFLTKKTYSLSKWLLSRPLPSKLATLILNEMKENEMFCNMVCNPDGITLSFKKGNLVICIKPYESRKVLLPGNEDIGKYLTQYDLELIYNTAKDMADECLVSAKKAKWRSLMKSFE